jgi:DNA relaxase NicK
MNVEAGSPVIDAVTLVFPDGTDPRHIMESVGGEFEDGVGRYNYASGARSSTVPGVSVYWDGRVAGMGVCLQLMGEGCRWLEESRDWSEFASWAVGLGGRCSRLDICVDETSGTVTVPDLIEMRRRGDVSYRGGSWRVVEDHGRRGSAATLYLGSRQSTVMLRCYDKGAQLGVSSYTRFEFEFKGARARAVFPLVARGAWDRIMAWCRSLFEFKDRDHRTVDVTRRRAAEWWVRLMGSCKQAVRLGRDAAASVQRAWNWLAHQASAYVAALLEVAGGDIGFLTALAEVGRRRMRDRHRALVELARTQEFAPHLLTVVRGSATMSLAV